MNRGKRFLMMVVCGLLLIAAQAQDESNATALKTIRPYSIRIGFTKTSNIIFPFKIVSVDRGSSAIMVQKGKGAENILQLKAARQHFKETNLTVVTADGKLFSFLVNYTNEPDSLNIYMGEDLPNRGASLILTNNNNAAVLNNEASSVKNQKSFLHAGTSGQGIKLHLTGIHLGEHSMWFCLEVNNFSFIDFKPDQISFYIKNKNRSKRSAQQEQICQPIFCQSLPVIKGKETRKIILAFEPFTVPSNRKLEVVINDKNCSLGLRLKIRNHLLVKAKPITE